ncbi:hypothetical protein DFH09DRAFT_1355920 [Mycena vulgaris]|nr:hypothetical protein DFH09DRAFT_1355920 [Mycena vulgaris]
MLETSTDPDVIAYAADLAVDLQWPVDLDLAPQMTRLRDAFLACFDIARDFVGLVTLKSIRAGMKLRAISYGRAYCSLRLVHQADSSASTGYPELELVYQESFDSPELMNVVRMLQGAPHLARESDVPLATKWALHVIPSLRPYNHDYDTSWTTLDYFLGQVQEYDLPHLDASSFCDYLFCVNSFLCPMNIRDMAWMDKSGFQDVLFGHLFKVLTSRIKQHDISSKMAAKILHATAQLVIKLENQWNYRNKARIYTFCSIIPRSPEWADVVRAAATLAKVNTAHRRAIELYSATNAVDLPDEEWVYTALENLDDPGQSIFLDELRRHRLEGKLRWTLRGFCRRC